MKVIEITVGAELIYKGVECKCTDILKDEAVLLEDKYGNEVWIPACEAEVIN